MPALALARARWCASSLGNTALFCPSLVAKMHYVGRRRKSSCVVVGCVTGGFFVGVVGFVGCVRGGMVWWFDGVGGGCVSFFLSPGRVRHGCGDGFLVWLF